MQMVSDQDLASRSDNFRFIAYLHIVDLDGGSMSLPCESTPVGTAASAATKAATTILTSILAADITDPQVSQPVP